MLVQLFFLRIPTSENVDDLFEKVRLLLLILDLAEFVIDVRLYQLDPESRLLPNILILIISESHGTSMGPFRRLPLVQDGLKVGGPILH